MDGRSLDHKTLETIRRMAVQRVREGEQPSAVIKSYGMNRTVIYKWLKADREGGESALAAKKPTGRPSTLTASQKQMVKEWINGKNPRQYGFDFGLWTRKTVAELIKKRFGVEMKLTAVGELLSKLEITPQKPLQRAYQRDPAAVAQWKEVEYPKLRKRAKELGGEVFFLDEAGIRSDVPAGRTWALRGHRPVVYCTGDRQHVNAISAINNRGGFWYETYTGILTADRFIEFLRKFVKAQRRKRVFLVLDRLSVHRAEAVRRYVESLKGRLELHYLPGYAPETNPDEWVWSHLRRNGVSKMPLRKGESLWERVNVDLQNIKSNRSLVKSFFHAPDTLYAVA